MEVKDLIKNLETKYPNPLDENTVFSEKLIKPKNRLEDLLIECATTEEEEWDIESIGGQSYLEDTFRIYTEGLIYYNWDGLGPFSSFITIKFLDLSNEVFYIGIDGWEYEYGFHIIEAINKKCFNKVFPRFLKFIHKDNLNSYELGLWGSVPTNINNNIPEIVTKNDYYKIIYDFIDAEPGYWTDFNEEILGRLRFKDSEEYLAETLNEFKGVLDILQNEDLDTNEKRRLLELESVKQKKDNSMMNEGDKRSLIELYLNNYYTE